MIDQVTLTGVVGIVGLSGIGTRVLPMDAPACCTSDGALAPEALLFGVGGLVMITLHCSGMCGPLIASLRFGFVDGAAHSRLARGVDAVSQLLAYQCGRILVYALAGALAGLAGEGLARIVSPVASVTAALVAAGFLFAALRELGLFGATRPPAVPSSLLATGTRLALRVARGRPQARAFLLGLALAFLPCMLSFWVLGLAASRGRMVDGALLMALLVVLTTPVLLVAALLPATACRSRGWAWVQPATLLFSALWLGLITLAANGLVPHAHLDLGGYLVMFW